MKSLLQAPRKSKLDESDNDNKSHVKRSVSLAEKESHDVSIIELTRDHKPDIVGERVRIELNGGEVLPCINENGEYIGPSRVWVKNEGFPGLAISRSFGDTVAASVGVSVYPEISEYTLMQNDAFVVLASDGVWDLLTNQEVAEIVYPFYFSGTVEKASEEVVKHAFRRWKTQEKVTDDITCVVMFLNGKPE